MSIFNKFFGSKSKKPAEDSKKSDRGKHMPKIEVPIDEKFMIEFKENGGKFLYCSDESEVLNNYNLILAENNWAEKSGLVTDKDLKKRLKSLNFNTTKNIKDATYLVTNVEALVAQVGALLISSNQIAEIKLNEYPNNLIVFATTSQIVQSIGEGLTDIKNKNKPKIPSNITTIKNFKVNDNQSDNKDFLTYGSNAKNVYLLLLEDL